MSIFSSEVNEDYKMPDRVDESNVVIIEPFRFIKPYPFVFFAGPKERWVGEKLVDVFAKEFKQHPKEVYEQKIRDGHITVNKKRIPIDYRIGPKDMIRHVTMRIEPPIYNKPLLKLGEVPDYVAYLKPGSVSVNTVSTYFYNTMVKILPPNLYVVHRLDKVTSGIIVFGKSKEAAQKFRALLSDDKIHKTYLARVIGVFPEGEIIVDQPIDTDYQNNKMFIGENGKPSKTIFKRLETNGKESIVECHPITGRTHQIRIHLSYLGFPISNDEKYGGKRHEYTKKERRALKKAEKLGLWPCDLVSTREDHYMDFQIYLHSIHYQTQEFDFHAPYPDWYDLNKDEDADDNEDTDSDNEEQSKTDKQQEKKSFCRI